MFGLSQSSDAQSVPELVRFARQDASPKVRGEAIFWLAQKAGQRAAAESPRRSRTIRTPT